MTNYSDNIRMCRVDFFRDTGKWYCTEAIEFKNEHYELHPTEALMLALREQLVQRLRGMWAICLDPYVESAFPVMIKFDW